MLFEKQKVMSTNNKIVGAMKDWFSSYVKTFKQGDKNFQENIILKEKHTMQVCKEILNIGEQLGLNDNELCLAEIIALFHDIGRFEQYARYKTFVDRQSEDHAELGMKILKRNNVLSGFDDPAKSLVFRTIRYHNRVSLPQNETEPCLFFTKLLRDADKLDIWRVVTDYYHRKDGGRNSAIELGLPDTSGFSGEVYRDLIHKRIVDVGHVKNLNDFKLLQIGWIFDINFEPTFHSIRSRRYLEMIRDVLPETKKIQEIFNVTQRHIDRHPIQADKEIL
jgi:putative nucleotidyltransferase with HDIG domain